MRLYGFLASLCVLVAACGGGSGSGSSGDTSDPRAFAKTYLLTNANVFSGQTSARDLLNLYTAKCRERTNEKDLSSAILMAQAFVPKIKGVKFEDADFGDKFKSTKTANGYEVTVPGTSESRLKIDGKWGNAHEQLVTLGLEEPGDGNETQKLTLELVDGKLLATDCDAISLR
jgi:hypothetical protein